jgi:hypothetical protein
VTTHVGAGGGIVLKMLKYIVSKLQCVNWSSSPCSLQGFPIPIGSGRQKQTYNNLDTHCSENARDNPSGLPCCCHTLPHMSSECRQVKCSMLMLIWLQHTHLWGSDFPRLPQQVWETVDMHTGWAGCHHSRLRRRQLCINFGGWMFEHLVSVGNKLQLFFRILQWFCLFSNLNQTPYDNLWHCKDAHPTYSCLIIIPCCGPSFSLTQFGHGVFLQPLHLSVQM